MSDRLNWFVLGILLSILLPGPVRADTDLDAVALVVVRGTDARDINVSRTGTAFLVGQHGALITSNHTIAPPESGWAMDEFGIKKVQMTVIMRDQVTGLPTDARPATVKISDVSIDAAILEVSGTPHPGLSSCPEPTISTGDTLQVVGVEPGAAGQPPSLDPREGALSEPRASDAPFARVSVATKPGFSGGPVFKKEPDGKRSLAGMLKAGDPLNATTHSLIVPLAAMREKVLAACDIPCRHPDHGIDHYRVSQAGDMHVSDWQRGGGDPVKYCDAYAGAERRSFPSKIITVIHAAPNDDRFFTGWRGSQYIIREAQYKYECQLQYKADPIYVLMVSKSCPTPANPLDLPR